MTGSTIRWRFTAKCPHCGRRLWAWGPNRLYRRLGTHFRAKHWPYYLRRGVQLWDDLDNLID